MFTKGKWEISKKQKGSQGWLSWRVFCDNASGFRPIAKVYLCDIEHTNTHFKDVAEGEANAKLIAAAPELLSVLEQILDMYRGVPLKDFQVASRDYALNIIAKAKGEI